MASIRAAQPHFIRCIKPNREKKPDFFDSDSVLRQLQYTGVSIDTIAGESGAGSDAALPSPLTISFVAEPLRHYGDHKDPLGRLSHPHAIHGVCCPISCQWPAVSISNYKLRGTSHCIGC